MTLAEHDKRCNDLFRKLDSLKAAGQGGKVASVEYMETLQELQRATRERLAAAGLRQKALGEDHEMTETHTQHTECSKCRTPFTPESTLLETVTGICNQCRDAERQARYDRLGR